MTTVITLDKTTKLILAAIAFGLFLNAAPKFTQLAHAELFDGARIKVEITDMPYISVGCDGCN